jgi:hypothetical protein
MQETMAAALVSRETVLSVTLLVSGMLDDGL